MSSFCVYGVTEQAAKAKATKKVKTVARGGVMKPVQQYEDELSAVTEALFESMKPMQISPAFDAPQFARDWGAIAARTIKCRDLKVMAKVPKLDKSDNIVKSKKTGRPILAWKPFSQEDMRLAA